jgi:hypothetical protein
MSGRAQIHKRRADPDRGTKDGADQGDRRLQDHLG